MTYNISKTFEKKNVFAHDDRGSLSFSTDPKGLCVR